MERNYSRLLTISLVYAQHILKVIIDINVNNVNIDQFLSGILRR